MVLQMLTSASMEAISLLYESDAQPVIGVSGRTVRFLNLAARNLFGDVLPGDGRMTIDVPGFTGPARAMRAEVTAEFVNDGPPVKALPSSWKK